MPVLNFKERFAANVAVGRKRQTVRVRRKRPIRPGDRLYLYTGMRTKRCRKLGEATCKRVDEIVIELNVDETIWVNGQTLSRPERLVLARADGFVSVGRFVAFFRRTYGLPFEGVIVKW